MARMRTEDKQGLLQYSKDRIKELTVTLETILGKLKAMSRKEDASKIMSEVEEILNDLGKKVTQLKKTFAQNKKPKEERE